MMSFESSSLCEISSKYFVHSRMKRGGRHSGPKRSTQRKGKEYKTMRRAQLAEFVAKKRGQGGREGLNNEGSSSSDRGVQEEVRDAYSEPAYRQGDFVIILKDTRPGVSYTASYEKEGRVTQVIDIRSFKFPSIQYDRPKFSLLRDEQRWMARGTEEKYSKKRERVQEYRM